MKLLNKIPFEQILKEEEELRDILNSNTKKSDTILDVQSLKMFFKYANTGPYKYNKAVHNVSFKVKRGEVFGLVGESGCGKTTTGRSIIKLYNITSGSVYFNDVRIAYGARFDQKEIKYSVIKAKKAIAELNRQRSEEIQDVHKTMEEEQYQAVVAQINAKYDKLVQEIDEKTAKHVAETRELINQGRFDQKYCDKQYGLAMEKKVADHFAPELAKYEGRELNETEKAEFEALQAKVKRLRKKARKETIMSHIQMIFQDPISSLNPRMTVREIISEGLLIRGIKDKKYIAQRVDEALKMVGLVSEHATRYPHEFSGGQRQRIGIARALIMEPEMIVADEPISALDVSIQAQVINLLNDIKEKMNLTILFIAHDLSVVKYFCDRIAVMYYGKIVEMASSDELFLNPMHPYTRSLLSAIPEPDPIAEKNRKRIRYNPAVDSVYEDEQPTLKEIKPGHFVLCDTKEFEKYKKIVKQL